MLSIPFVGELRSKILKEAGFSSVKDITEASVDALSELDGFSQVIAEEIKKYADKVREDYSVPKETVFREFRCPECGAVVSEIEPYCHKCGYKFFTPPEKYEENKERLADVIIGIYRDPENTELWREGAKILKLMDLTSKSSDFRFKASAIEFEHLEREEIKRGREEKKLYTDKEKPVIRLSELYKKSMVNGLVNGTGSLKKEIEKDTRSRYFVPIVVLFLIIPVLFTSVMIFALSPPVVIDGSFSDWSKAPSLNEYSGNFDAIKYECYGGYTYLYISSAHITTGARLLVLIDDDENLTTGYPYKGLGVDKFIYIHIGKNSEGTLYGYENGVWSKLGTVIYAYSRGGLELKTAYFGDKTMFLVGVASSDGTVYESTVLSTSSLLYIEYRGGTVVNSGDVIESVYLWNAYTGKIELKSIDIVNIGNGSARINIKYNGYGDIVYVKPGVNHVELNPYLAVNTKTELVITYVDGGSKYQTLKFKIQTNYLQYSVDYSNGSYIMGIPNRPTVDGVFLDWYNRSVESPRNSAIPASVDIRDYGKFVSNSTYVYIQTYGNLFEGYIPNIAIYGNGTSTANITTNPSLPNDTLEIYIDTDHNYATGYRIGNIGAEIKVMITGYGSKIQKTEEYRWESDKWLKIDEYKIKTAKNAKELETSVGISGDVYFRLVNWRGVYDALFKSMIPEVNTEKYVNETKGDVKGVHTLAKSVTPKLVGKYSFAQLKALFGTDVQVTNSTKNETRPTITETSDGTLWVTYDYEYSATDHDLYFANSTDGGLTWNVYALDTTTYDIRNPVIVSNNTTVLIFFENHTSGSYFKYYAHSINEGTTWHIYSISTWTWWSNIYNISAVQYTISTSTYIYVFFEYRYSSTDYDVGYIKSPNGGKTWYNYSSYPNAIAQTSNWEGHPSVSIYTGTTPKVFIAYDWYDSKLNKWNVTVLNNSNMNDTKWWGYIFTSKYGRNYTYPAVYATSNVVYLCFEYEYSASDHNIMLWNSTSAGYSWNFSSYVATTTDDERYPTLVANGANVWLFYVNVTTGYLCMRNSTNYGVNWSNAVVVSDSATVLSGYRCAYAYLDSSGKIYVVWSDNRNSNSDIYLDTATIPEFNISWMLIGVLIIIPLLKRKRCE